MLKNLVIAIIFMVFILGSTTYAEKAEEHQTFKGTLSCLGCELKKRDGANAQCSVYNHRHALKIAEGKFILFLENDNSASLIKGNDWHGKSMEVTGTYIKDANILDVESYNVDGKSYNWCKNDEQMDICSEMK